MNLRIPLFSLLLLFPAVSALAESKPALAHAVGSVVRYDQTIVARGFTTAQVQLSLGPVRQKLGPQIWVYYNFNGGAAQDARDDCDTLLITFVEDRVADMKLVNRRALQIYAAQIRARDTDKVQVATK